MKISVLVIGANGQLGKTLADISKNYTSSIDFTFVTKTELNILSTKDIKHWLKNNFKYCINCAAYTNVEKAELEEKQAYKINAEAVKFLAIACRASHTTLIHLSTDYVFDGKKSKPYTESDLPNPINIYGKSKLLGEKFIQDEAIAYYIIRTSWLYSLYKSNFLKTMLNLSEKLKEIQVINDQIGTPTDALSLATALCKMILNDKKEYGIYNFSNEGEASWYNFAKAIFEIKGTEVIVNPIPAIEYTAKAQRPNYSVLNKSKIKEVFELEIPNWRDSLQLTISKL